MRLGSFLRTYTIFSICLFLSFLSNGQTNYNVNFSTIKTDNGLPNNSVNTIIKDHLGFVWIGTNDGLCRYESSGHVKIYRNGTPEIKGGIESNNIRTLYLDSKDNLWIGTRLGGLTKFNQSDNNWTTYRHDKANPQSISNDEVLSITEDSKGRLWVGTEDGLNVYDYKSQKFTRFKANDKDPFSLKSKAILSIYEDDKGWIWVGTWAGGLHLFIPNKNGELAKGRFRLFTPNDKSGSANIWSVLQDSKDRYWIGSRGEGVFLMTLPEGVENVSAEENWQPSFFNYKYDKHDKQCLSSNNIQDIFEDNNNELWIATVKGLNRVVELESTIGRELEGNSVSPKFSFYTYYYSPSNFNSITNNDVSTILEDDQGIFWFGTYSGVSQYNPLANQFEVYEFFDDISKTPNAQNLFIDDNQIAWIGNGENGLLKYNLENGTIINTGNDFDFLSGKNANSLFSPDKEHLYISTTSGIFVYNMRNKSVKKYPFPKQIIERFNNPFVRSMIKDKAGRVWVGSEDGLLILFEENGSYLPVLNDLSNPNSISDNAVNKVFEDSNGDVWVATFNGLNRLKKSLDDQFLFDRFKHDPENQNNSILSNRSVGLEEVDGILYIGSDMGLGGYDLEKDTFINFSKNDDSHSIQSIEKTIDGNLWASTTEGIIFYDINLKIFNQYKKQDGLGDIIFQTGSSFRDKHGCLYFGSRRGITKFDPKKIKKNDTPPPVYLTDIKIMSPEGEENNNSTFEDEIILNHDEYYLSLNYVALNYNRSEKNKYAFKLEGFDKDWNYSNIKSPAIYTNLKHGEYVFRVKAANNDGIWNEKGIALKIIKKPAFWETWWFRILMLLSLGALILGVFKLYIRNIKNRNKALKKYNDGLNAEIKRRELVEKELQEREVNIKKYIVELKRSNKDLEQFAYIASHDLQEPLRVVGGFISLLRRRYSQHFDESAFEYIDFAVDGVKRMSQQIKNILTFSKVGKDDINPEYVNLNNIVKLKMHDLSQKIKEKNAKISVTPLPMIFCEKNQIEMVFYNLISNALKFNKSEEPTISIAHDAISSKEFWQFSVKDNGIGIESEYKKKIFEIFKRLHNNQEYEGTGIGLTLCEKIIHRHNGMIWFESNSNEGTTFYFTISKKLQRLNKFKNNPISPSEELSPEQTTMMN